VAAAADSGNGISAVLDFERYIVVNSDLTINLPHRPCNAKFVGTRACLKPEDCALHRLLLRFTASVGEQVSPVQRL
jgi:hypothetical protein